MRTNPEYRAHDPAKEQGTVYTEAVPNRAITIKQGLNVISMSREQAEMVRADIRAALEDSYEND